MVKAFDSKSNGIFPRRFESYLQRVIGMQSFNITISHHVCKLIAVTFKALCCDGRVVKAFD